MTQTGAQLHEASGVQHFDFMSEVSVIIKVMSRAIASGYHVFQFVNHPTVK